MSRSRSKPVRIIDHDPLPETASPQSVNPMRHGSSAPQGRSADNALPGDAPVFGKRHSEKVADEIVSAKRPFAENGISEYFLRRVSEHRNEQANPSQSERRVRSAIRQPLRSASGDFSDDNGLSRIPLAALATVAAVAFAIPMGFIFFTEQITGPDLDTMTTASISAADGIVVQNVAMTKILKNGTFVVSVHGKIANRGSESKSLMPLVISLRDEEGREVQSWRHRLGKTKLKDDATLHFRTSAIDYSGSAKTAHVVARTVK